MSRTGLDGAVHSSRSAIGGHDINVDRDRSCASLWIVLAKPLNDIFPSKELIFPE